MYEERDHRHYTGPDTSYKFADGSIRNSLREQAIATHNLDKLLEEGE